MKNLLATTILLTCSSLLLGQWIPCYGPEGATINCFAGTSNCIIAGADRGLYYSYDDGETWQSNEQSLQLGLVYRLLLHDSMLYAGTSYGVHQSSDKGLTWTEIADLKTVSVFAMHAHKNNLYVAGRQAYALMKSTDGGLTWKPFKNGLSNYTITAIESIEDTLYVSTSAGGVFSSIDHGQNWIPCNTGLSLHNVVGLNTVGQTLIAATNGGGIYISGNGGRTWKTSNQGLSDLNLSSLHASDSNLYLGSLFGGFYISNNAGKSWTQRNTGLSTYTDIKSAYLYHSKLFVGTSYGSVFKWDHIQATWQSKSKGIYETFIQAFKINEDRLLCLTRNNGLFLSENQGRTWSACHTSIRDKNPKDMIQWQGTLYVCGQDFGVYKSIDKGKNWNLSNTGLINTKLNCISHQNGKIYVGGNGFGVWQSANQGFSWQAANKGIEKRKVIAMNCAENLICIATDSGIYLSSDSAGTWQKISTPNNQLDFNLVSIHRKDIYCGMNSGKLYVFRAQQQAWESVEYSTLKSSVKGLAFHQADVYVGTAFGVHQSLDSGKTWQTFEDGMPPYVKYGLGLCVMRDSIFLAIPTLGVWKRAVTVANTKILMQSANTSLTLFPNPGSQSLHIESREAIHFISIHTVVGELLLEKRLSGLLLSEELDISAFDNGVYLIQISTANGLHTKRFMVSH